MPEKNLWLEYLKIISRQRKRDKMHYELTPPLESDKITSCFEAFPKIKIQFFQIFKIFKEIAATLVC